jgi:hypothetical protein
LLRIRWFVCILSNARSHFHLELVHCFCGATLHTSTTQAKDARMIHQLVATPFAKPVARRSIELCNAAMRQKTSQRLPSGSMGLRHVTTHYITSRSMTLHAWPLKLPKPLRGTLAQVKVWICALGLGMHHSTPHQQVPVIHTTSKDFRDKTTI